MSENKLQTSLIAFDKVLNSETPFLTIFFYASPAQRENLELLIQFFQKHRFAVEWLQNKKLSGSLHKVVRNANFVAHTYYFMSEAELERLGQFVISNVIVIALFYKKKIWTGWRLRNFNTVLSLSLSPSRFNVLETDLQQLNF